MKTTTILLTAMLVLAISGSAAAAASTRAAAIPTATPESALNAEQVNALLDDLQNGLAERIDDESSVAAISKKWDTHTNLAGKTRSQILPLLMADVRTIVTDKETRDAIWASWNDGEDEAAAAPAPKPEGKTGGGWITLVHHGYYTASFDATWDEPGKASQKFHAETKTNGYQQTLTFPADATNIRLHITNDTGLAWEPKHDIIDRSLTPADMNKCLVIEGTTMQSTMRLENCDTPAAEGKAPAGTQNTATWIGLSHNGSYIAHFNVIWDEPGRPDQTFHADEGPGFNKTLNFPRGASNFRVKITNDTGLNWEPTHEIFNRSLTSAELNKCLVVDGAALGPRIRFEACDPSSK
jgi:hypothetical protein